MPSRTFFYEFPACHGGRDCTITGGVFKAGFRPAPVGALASPLPRSTCWFHRVHRCGSVPSGPPRPCAGLSRVPCAVRKVERVAWLPVRSSGRGSSACYGSRIAWFLRCGHAAPGGRSSRTVRTVGQTSDLYQGERADDARQPERRTVRAVGLCVDPRPAPRRSLPANAPGAQPPPLARPVWQPFAPRPPRLAGNAP